MQREISENGFNVSFYYNPTENVLDIYNDDLTIRGSGSFSEERIVAVADALERLNKENTYDIDEMAYAMKVLSKDNQIDRVVLEASSDLLYELGLVQLAELILPIHATTYEVSSRHFDDESTIIAPNFIKLSREDNFFIYENKQDRWDISHERVANKELAVNLKEIAQDLFVAIENNKLLQVKEAIIDYTNQTFKQEFKVDDFNTLFPNQRDISLGYLPTEDARHDIHLSLDLEHLIYKTSIDDKISTSEYLLGNLTKNAAFEQIINDLTTNNFSRFTQINATKDAEIQSVSSMKETLLSLSNESYENYIKALISVETGVDDLQTLDNLYENYMDTDHQGLLDASFYSELTKHSDYWIVEFNESDNKFSKNYKGQLVTKEMLAELQELDQKFKTHSVMAFDEYNAMIHEEYYGYYKFYFDHIVNGQAQEHERVDIGDGPEVNRDFFAYMYKQIDPNYQHQQLEQVNLEEKSIANTPTSELQALKIEDYRVGLEVKYNGVPCVITENDFAKQSVSTLTLKSLEYPNLERKIFYSKVAPISYFYARKTDLMKDKPIRQHLPNTPETANYENLSDEFAVKELEKLPVPIDPEKVKAALLELEHIYGEPFSIQIVDHEIYICRLSNVVSEENMQGLDLRRNPEGVYRGSEGISHLMTAQDYDSLKNVAYLSQQAFLLEMRNQLLMQQQNMEINHLAQLSLENKEVNLNRLRALDSDHDGIPDDKDDKPFTHQQDEWER